MLYQVFFFGFVCCRFYFRIVFATCKMASNYLFVPSPVEAAPDEITAVQKEIAAVKSQLDRNTVHNALQTLKQLISRLADTFDAHTVTATLEHLVHVASEKKRCPGLLLQFYLQADQVPLVACFVSVSPPSTSGR